MLKLSLIALAVSLANVTAAIKTQVVEYKDGETVLQGWAAWDDSIVSQRPGILIVHQWKGLTEYEKKRAEMLAKLGYVAFAVDIYGKGVRPQQMQEAAELSSKYKSDRALLRRRVRAGLDQLRQLRGVARDQVAAIGYCFGGTTVLELARSGADVAGVVSFHGGLSTPTPEDATKIKAKVLALHGADDPFVPPAEVQAFQEEMRKGGVDWQMVSYGNAVHSFTDWNMPPDNSKGAAYNEKADKRSWEAMKLFFDELFGAAR